MKNGMPMTPVAEILDKAIFGADISKFKFCGNEVTYNNDRYTLCEPVDTIDNQVFVSVDFYLRIFNNLVSITGTKIKLHDSFDPPYLTEKSSLFIKKGEYFSIEVLNSIKKSMTIPPEIGLMGESPIVLSALRKVWVIEPDGMGGQNRYEKDTYGPPKTIMSFKSKETGRYMIDNFTIIVVD
ncbi:hypothetical protein [Dysgonomonas sp. 521]|uniref:hypothetical protein n=1 Tax=Dysgonomonas sp. 521 TaxID=2302932 RepID=UPI0013D1D664|nr:hypothetical protein [Dysgonomonas sp. 521]